MPIPACCDAQKRDNRSEVLQDALGAFHEQREPPRNPAQVRDGAEDRESRNEREAPNRFGSTSSSPREMILSSSPSPFIARKGAVSHSLHTNRIYLPRILACTYFVLRCFLARVCEKSRFPRLGALIPLLDGFLHDIRPHLTAHPPACAKLSWHGENRPAFTLRPSVLPRSRIGRRCCPDNSGLARRRAAS